MTDVPAHLRPYLDALGVNDAVKFLIAFGGAPVYLAAKPTKRSAVVQLIGVEKAARLAKEIGPGQVHVPLCKPWLAHQLRSTGMSIVGIARKLHVNDSTVRRYFASGRAEQLSLF